MPDEGVELWAITPMQEVDLERDRLPKEVCGREGERWRSLQRRRVLRRRVLHGLLGCDGTEMPVGHGQERLWFRGDDVRSLSGRGANLPGRFMQHRYVQQHPGAGYDNMLGQDLTGVWKVLRRRMLRRVLG